MHRVVRIIPVRQVAAGGAAGARRNLQIIVVVDVARSAGHIRVALREQEPCRAVIKRRAGPTRGRVAVRAIHRRKLLSRRCVRRVVRITPCLLYTSDAADE